MSQQVAMPKTLLGQGAGSYLVRPAYNQVSHPTAVADQDEITCRIFLLTGNRLNQLIPQLRAKDASRGCFSDCQNV